jgi:hypothetical protein
MKPIETIWKGFRFRSRIEARWAVFYETLGIRWEYEKEGFDLGSGVLYLPDFYIPHLNCWVEIKGEKIGGCATKCETLAELSGQNVYIFYGTIRDNLEHPNGNVFFGDCGGVWDGYYWWCECNQCGKFGIEFEGRSDRICHHSKNDNGYNPHSPALLKAYAAAQSARFEFGGKP